MQRPWHRRFRRLVRRVLTAAIRRRRLAALAGYVALVPGAETPEDIADAIGEDLQRLLERRAA